MLFDSGDGGVVRILIFRTNPSIQLLSKSAYWFGDGTGLEMTLCSNVFFQICALHAQIHERVLPSVCALLPTKIELIYNRLLLQIREIVPK